MPFASAMRVLIVDDQLTSRLLIRGGLQDLGVSDIEMAANGEEGLKAMMAKPAHLVISDFICRSLTGSGFCERYAHPPTKNIGFILLTGKSDKELIERAAKYGVNNVIAKAIHDAGVKGEDRGRCGEIEMMTGTSRQVSAGPEPGAVGERRIHIVQGEYHVISDPSVMLTTLLARQRIHVPQHGEAANFFKAWPRLDRAAA